MRDYCIEGGGGVKSINYGQDFSNIVGASYKNHSELGWKEMEVFAVGTITPYQGILTHTFDFNINNTLIPIDSQYVFGQINGIFPDVYRGGKSGEVYVSSWFPDDRYRVSFSADTGHTFRHVYISEEFSPIEDHKPFFMSDREPGVFYIIKCNEIEDTDTWGWHIRICIEYYRDYGATLVDTYCHDLTKDYVNEVGIKEVEKNGDIEVYPNPTTGELSIQVNKNTSEQVNSIEIFDIYGQKLYSSTCPPVHLFTINISPLPAGVYFVRISTEKGVVMKKVVKQ